MKNLKDIVMVITGASSGIGRATALECARREGSVVIAARRKSALEELKEECIRNGGKAIAIPTDVSKEEDVENLFNEAIKEYGKVDVWLNNAAVTMMGPFDETPLKDIKRLLDVNVLGYIHGAYQAVPHFKDRKKGLLVNVSSMVGETGQPYSTAYTVSKFAIRGLSLGLEQELSDEKEIHVCSVLPAVIDTPIFNQAAIYMGKAVKPPEPIIPAQEVGEAILDLIHNPKKEIIVGTMAKASKLAKALAPGLFDKKFRETIEEEHFQDEHSAPSSGNLYEPMPEWSKISGGWLEESQASKEVPTVAIAGAAIAGAALGASFMMSENGKSLKAKIKDLIK